MQGNKKTLLKVIERVPPKMVKKIVELSDGCSANIKKTGKINGQKKKWS